MSELENQPTDSEQIDLASGEDMSPDSFVEQPQNTASMTPEELPAKQASFLHRRLDQIKNGYEGLSTKQKDFLQMGAMALSTTVFPIGGIVTGHNVEASESMLAWEGLIASYGVAIGAALKYRKLMKQGKV